jgi:hypothetical protein
MTRLMRVAHALEIQTVSHTAPATLFLTPSPGTLAQAGQAKMAQCHTCHHTPDPHLAPYQSYGLRSRLTLTRDAMQPYGMPYGHNHKNNSACMGRLHAAV